MLLYLLGGGAEYLDANWVILGVVLDEGERNSSTFLRGLLGESRRVEERTISTFLRVCLESLDKLKNGLSRRS